MRDHDVDTRVEAPGLAAAANGSAAVERKRRKRKTRRRWSAEEKIRIVRESFASGESVTTVAERHAITRRQLSSWRTQLREGKLAAPSSARAQPGGAFAAVEVEERCLALIEGRGVTVRLEGIADAAGIASIAVALAGSR
jgi:transposase